MPRWTVNDLLEYERRQEKLKAHADQTRRQLQSPQPERHQEKSLGKTGDGKEHSIQRTGIRFIGYRIRMLDPDNFAGGCKDLLDGLQHAGLIYDDSPDKITAIFEQNKVYHKKDERTEIELTFPSTHSPVP